MTLLWKEGVEEVSRAGLSRWNRRKCARWLVPNWVSKPSAVVPSVVLMTPALLIRMLSFPALAWSKEVEKVRTESSELRSRCRRSTLPGERIYASASRPLVRSRAVREGLAPVFSRARAVSMPMPELQPVIRMVLSARAPTGGLVSDVGEAR
jgi:hypothetical protein